jgi:transposase
MEFDYRSNFLEAEDVERNASAFLSELYEITGRNQLMPVNMFELCTNQCLDQNEIIEVVQYLKEQRLIRSMGYQTVGITLDGIEMVEKA